MTDDIQTIIIRVDTDFLRQIRSNQIIDLEKNEQNTNTNSINLSFLARLFQNSRNDQLYKRVRQSKTRKKSIEMICSVCDNRAIGYNYDVPTCGSCKIFFHRWANSNLDELICCEGKDQCLVSHKIRRKCRKCRLRKCFHVGMRKDFLINQKQQTTNIEDISLQRLTIEDWTNIEYIRSSFLFVFETNFISHSTDTNSSDRISALIIWSHIANEIVVKFIRFFRSIEHFEKLNNDDRFLLIKYNLAILCPILKCFYQNSILSQYDDYQRTRFQFVQLCFNSQNLIDNFTNLVYCFVQITNQDSIIISLLLIILLFFQGLSIDENALFLNDSLAIYRIQSYYLDLLWKYFLHKYGEMESIKRFNQLDRAILRLQFISKTFREYLNDQFVLKDDADKLAPLIQTVLRIC